MDVDNKEIYSLCRRKMLFHSKKFYFLYVMYVINFSVKGPVIFSRLSKEPTAINRLKQPNLADCKVIRCEYKRN